MARLIGSCRGVGGLMGCPRDRVGGEPGGKPRVTRRRGGCVVIGQIVWTIIVAVLLLAVAVGWAMRGAMEVHEGLAAPRQRHEPVVVRPEILNLLSNRGLIFASAFVLALALLFFARSMDRGLQFMGAVVLSFAYALLCAMVTGFTVWMRAQRNAQADRPQAVAGTFRWAAWVGLGLGAVAVIYLAVDVFSTLAS